MSMAALPLPLPHRDRRIGSSAAAATCSSLPSRQLISLYCPGAVRQQLNFWKFFVYFYRKNL
jgi:hypothetical protein